MEEAEAARVHAATNSNVAPKTQHHDIPGQDSASSFRNRVTYCAPSARPIWNFPEYIRNIPSRGKTSRGTSKRQRPLQQRSRGVVVSAMPLKLSATQPTRILHASSGLGYPSSDKQHQTQRATPGAAARSEATLRPPEMHRSVETSRSVGHTHRSLRTVTWGRAFAKAVPIPRFRFDRLRDGA